MKKMRNNLIWFSLVALAIIFPVSCSIHGSPIFAAKPAPRIIVMSAFGAELDKLRSATKIESTQVINGRIWYIGELRGKKIILVPSGMSMVNAALTAQTAIDRFPVSRIVFSGIAGGVNPACHIGDVVVPAQWAQYQDQVFARETAGGWDVGSFGKEFFNYGMMFPQRVAVTQRGAKPDVEEPRFWFPVSPEMLATASQVASEVRLTTSTASGVSLTAKPKIQVGGNGVSGPTFVNNAAYREWVWKTFQANALDMESAAVAHVAYVNNVPFIAFRSLSDLAGGGPGENELNTFFQLAADNSAAVVMSFLQRLPRN